MPISKNEFFARVANNTLKLSYSSLKHLVGEPKPAAFMAYFTEPKPPPTPSIKFGSMLHKLVLESSDFFNQYIIKDVFSKEFEKKELLREKTERVTLKALQEVKKCAERVLKNEAVQQRLKNTDKEVYFTRNILGVPVHGFTDAKKERKEVTDLKTSTSINPRRFHWTCLDMFYYMQAAIYCEAFEVDKYYIIAAQKNGISEVFDCSERLDIGRAQMIDAIENYKILQFNQKFYGSSIWEDYTTKIKTL